MIYKKIFRVLPLFLIILIFSGLSDIVCAGEHAVNSSYYSFSQDDAIKFRKQADDLFVQAFESEDSELKSKCYRAAMRKYYVLSQVFPYDYYAFAQMARINDERNEDVLARKNFFIAFNLDKYNPYTNFYIAEFYMKREMYYKALKYYLTAYNNGYKDNYVANFKLAVLFEKLGDLEKSKQFYKSSYEIDSEINELKRKISSLESLNYDKSEYYHLIRE